MAITARVRFVDSYGRNIHKSVETTAATLADAVTAVTAYLAAMEDVTALGWEEVSYTNTAAVTHAADALSNRDVGATLRVVLASGKHFAYKIPGILASLLNASGSVDVADIAITTLIGLYATGEDLRVSDGEAISSVLSGQLDE